MKTPLLKQLTEIFAVSANEQDILSFITDYLKKIGLSINKTNAGDVYVGAQNPTLLLCAHVDEVGCVVTKVNDNGTCQISPVGLVTPKMLAGQQLVFTTADGTQVPAVVVYCHALDVDSVKSWSDVWVDVGFASAEECRAAGVDQGTFGTYARNWSETESKILANSLDNRIGVAYLLEVARKHKSDIQAGRLTIAFTTGEESDYVGIQAVSANISAKYAVIVDVMPHNFFPPNNPLALDGEPVVVYKMGKHMLLPQWREKLRNIPHQKYFMDPEPHFVLEPEVMQRYGHTVAMNYLVPVTNYHHSCYGVFKEALAKGEQRLHECVEVFMKVS